MSIVAPVLQSAGACKEAVQQFLERVGDLSRALLRLIQERNAGVAMPEQLSRFEALLREATMAVNVRYSRTD